MNWFFEPGALLWFALPAAIVVIAFVVRKFRTVSDSGDFVTQSVLVRINADYRERQ